MATPPEPPTDFTMAPPAVFAPTLSPSPPATQEPVEEGEPCEPEGAVGETVDDVELRCVRGADGSLRWQII